MENKTIVNDSVKISTIEKMIKDIRKTVDKDIDLSFEFIMSSFFPSIYNNIKEAYTTEYIRGFNDGQKEKCTCGGRCKNDKN